jgi:Amt family ammonium transporter
LDFIFSLSFAVCSVTIISGAVAERMNLKIFMLLAVVTIVVTYPFIVWSAWNPSGPLYKLGFVDYAGGAVVHLTGGTVALVSAWLVGPRQYRFEKVESEGIVRVREIPGHSLVLYTLGVFILFFGWLSFNASSAPGLAEGTAASIEIATRSAVNTALAPCLAVTVSVAVNYYAHNTISILHVNNAALAACVGVTAAAGNVRCIYLVLVCSIGSGLISAFGPMLLLMMGIDDVVDAFVVHGLSGFWSIIIVGLFNDHTLSGVPSQADGLFIGGSGYLLWVQLVSGVYIFVWSAGVTLVTLLMSRWLGKSLFGWPNCERVDKDVELLGLDSVYYEAYTRPEFDRLSALEHKERQRADIRRRMRNEVRKRIEVRRTPSSEEPDNLDKKVHGNVTPQRKEKDSPDSGSFKYAGVDKDSFHLLDRFLAAMDAAGDIDGEDADFV